MGLDGYVGTAEDSRRIMRQEKQREEQRKKYEALKKQSDANVDAAGLRQFGAAKTEVRWFKSCKGGFASILDVQL